jgi:hypothetical protein
MMTRFLSFLLALAVVFAPGGASAGDKRTLAGVFKPEMITIAGDELYVVEGAAILVYSLDGLRLVRKFGRTGEGPGEFRAADFWYNTVTVLPESVFVDGYDKAVTFSKDGTFLRESKKPLGISRMIPVGDNFVGVKLDHLEGDVQYQCLCLYNSKGTFLQELCRQESPVQSMTRKTEMIPDVLNFSVWADRIYVEKSREGFVIEVYDSRGAPLRRIENPDEKIRVTQDHKNEALEKMKTDPFVKRLGFEKFKSFSEFIWPEAWPSIMDFSVTDGKIYVRTSKALEEKERWVLLDLLGRRLGWADLPRVDAAPFMAALNGVHYYALHNHKLYFLKDNEKTEAWELFVEEFKEHKF